MKCKNKNSDLQHLWNPRLLMNETSSSTARNILLIYRFDLLPRLVIKSILRSVMIQVLDLWMNLIYKSVKIRQEEASEQQRHMEAVRCGTSSNADSQTSKSFPL